MEGASTGWCTVRAVSVTGVRHRLAGQAGEDSFAWSHDGARLALAVADGLGSVGGSGGASLRAAAAAVVAAAPPESGDGRGPGQADAPDEGQDGPERLAAAVEAADRAAAGGVGATTLVVALLDRHGHVDVARVGDSSAFVVWPDGSWTELFAPPDGGRIGTETAALPVAVTDPGGAVADVVEWASTDLVAGAVLALASDGVADPWRDGPTTVAPAVAEALVEVPSVLEVARLVDFSRQGCHDDRTLACAWWDG